MKEAANHQGARSDSEAPEKLPAGIYIALLCEIGVRSNIMHMPHLNYIQQCFYTTDLSEWTTATVPRLPPVALTKN